MLSQFVTEQLFVFLLVFCRLGSAIMFLPGFGEAYVLARVRLLLAAMFSLVVAPFLQNLPPIPTTVSGLAVLIIAEIMVGLFIGFICKILISTIQTASSIIAYQSGLASAMTQDLTAAQSQSTSLGNLIGMTALVLLFVTDLHHLMLRGLVDSYSLFIPGQFPITEDIANLGAKTLANSFRMATQIAGAHLVIGLILYLAAGIISRLMPNIQIFFIMTAPQLLISFFILMIGFSTMMMWYMDYFKDTLGGFLAP